MCRSVRVYVRDYIRCSEMAFFLIICVLDLVQQTKASAYNTEANTALGFSAAPLNCILLSRLKFCIKVVWTNSGYLPSQHNVSFSEQSIL